MRLRIILFCIFVMAHVVMAFLPFEAIAPVVGASVYLPLLLLKQIGLPVFAAGASGGWSSPSVLGWLILAIFWAIVWWAFASFIARYFLNRAKV
jgi:hypothetical protein